MSDLFNAVERIRDAVFNPMSNTRRGAGQGRAILNLDDIGELLRDWQEMDNRLRQLHDDKQREASFQSRVQPWMMECFGAEISGDTLERNDRFIEEALELVQALDYSPERAHALVDYVFGRPKGEPVQEAGGVMVTLAALCLANRLNMHLAGEIELARILDPAIVAKIRAKQAAKPTGSALPVPPA